MSQHTHVHPQGGIRRGPRLADNFSVLSNAVLNDERLSFRARGVLAWLLSKPLDWHIRSEAIAAQSPREGREAIRSTMRELVELGYLIREKVQDEQGRWSTIQTVYEEPRPSGDTPAPPKPRKSNSGQARDGKTGAFTKDGSPRTETNNNPAPQAPTSLVDALESVSSSEIAREELQRNADNIAELEAATLAEGLPATYAGIKPTQKTELLELIDRHGVDTLVQAAVRAHRPENPTMHVHGWIRLWKALSARPARTGETSGPPPMSEVRGDNDCDNCEHGWVLGPDRRPIEPAVRCACRTTTQAAA
ncbi:replication protein [Rhodococcus sp. HM1]|uniref:replication protein n=1 Tax=Rhodococcus sp. HM1 TaxID=2937759 RepID=UPI00200B4EA1|nr:replication protein [Rhodococcus sp. HM1]MCK8675013.1 replication protein [Rhodococcus sp. HM1]